MQGPEQLSTRAELPGHISYSQIHDYQRCPYLWALTRILGYKQPCTEPMLVGLVVHEALYRYFRWYTEQGEHNADAMDDIWRRLCRDPEIFPRALTEPSYGDGLAMLQRLLLENTLSFSDSILAEYDYNIVLEDVVLKGRIDRIDDVGQGMYRIIDYKTSAAFPSMESVADDLELSIYATAWREISGERDTATLVGIHDVRHDIYVEGIRSQEQMDLTAQYIVDTWYLMQNTATHKPNPGASCLMYGGCWALSLCPAQSLNVLEIGQETLDMAAMDEERLLLLYNSMECLLPKIRRFLRDSLKEKEQIQTENLEARLKPTTVNIQNEQVAEEFMEIFGGMGLDPMEFMRVDSRRFEKVCNRLRSRIEGAPASVEEKAFLLDSLGTLSERMYIKKQGTPKIVLEMHQTEESSM